MPAETVQPIVLYYNKRVFEKVGAQPPQSWGDIMNLVPKFNAAGIAPFSLGGQSRWTNMMWLEFLFDRIGGSEVFQAVADGQQGAWSNPAAIDALTKVQDLVKAERLHQGLLVDHRRLQRRPRPALHRQGRDDAARLVDLRHHVDRRRRLRLRRQPRLHELPARRGRQGRPDAPPPATRRSTCRSRRRPPTQQKETAKKFFATGVLTDAEIQDWIGTGGVPIVNGADAKLTGSKDADFLKFVYGVASKAKSFPQSWDQALSPTAAEKLLDNIAQLFQLSVTPQQFADNMNGVIGQ